MFYVLISAALLGRPYDHPEDTGLKAWEWLARHELAHIREGHLPWFFYIRRSFQFTWILFLVQCFLLGTFASNQTLYAWLKPSLCLGGIWFVQTIQTLFFEWRADFAATHSIKDPAILKDAEKKSLSHGCTSQSALAFFLGLDSIYYKHAILRSLSSIYSSPLVIASKCSCFGSC